MLRLCSESSRSYPGRSVQQAIFSLFYVGKPVGQNRRNKPTALTGDRFHLIANEKRDGQKQMGAAHQGVICDEIGQKSAEAIVA
ncbi:hypothetical protein BMS3Abin07_02063 [bacterium BMS3Abin07]|nr:hypothetical protein BMS3Abin07_02063 [bacterium BMS3Abin07]